MSEPIEHGGKLNETEEGRCELFVACADAAVALDAAEEVFDQMSAPVVAAVESHRPAAGAFRRDADARALPAQACAKRIGIEALVGHCAAPSQAGQQWFDGIQIIALATSARSRGSAA